MVGICIHIHIKLEIPRARSIAQGTIKRVIITKEYSEMYYPITLWGDVIMTKAIPLSVAANCTIYVTSADERFVQCWLEVKQAERY